MHDGVTANDVHDGEELVRDEKDTVREGRTLGVFSRCDVSVLKERAETADRWYDEVDM